jgi:hypothetical protein
VLVGDDVVREARPSVQHKLDAIAAALLERRKGNATAAQDELAQAIGLHGEV